VLQAITRTLGQIPFVSSDYQLYLELVSESRVQALYSSKSGTAGYHFSPTERGAWRSTLHPQSAERATTWASSRWPSLHGRSVTRVHRISSSDRASNYAWLGSGRHPSAASGSKPKRRYTITGDNPTGTEPRYWGGKCGGPTTRSKTGTYIEL